MNRKEFFSSTGKLALGAGTFLLLSGPEKAFSDSTVAEQEKQVNKKQEFIHGWLKNLLENMDSHMDEKKKIKLLEDCGRACAENHAKKEAEKHKGQLDGWLSVLKKWIGKENVQKEKNSIRVIYDKCFCPLVKDGPPLNSIFYCNCSRGWLKEVFETVAEKSVKVELEDSIMRGGKQCRFSVFL